MVVGAFPAVKLAVLLFKQISKPIAQFAKERAKNNRFFRTYVCMPPAHFYNWCEIQSKMWIMNLGKPVNIPQLNEQMAIELGANLLGEGIIFCIGAGVLIFEYNRSAKKEAVKEEERLQEMEHLNDTIRDLYFSVQKQNTELVQLQRTIYDLENRMVVKPWVPKKDDKDPNNPPPTEPPSLKTPIDLPSVGKKAEGFKNPSTPYPDRGIVLKSLNYLELAALNTPQSKEEPDDEEQTSKPLVYTRKSSILNDALLYIEKDVKGLL